MFRRKTDQVYATLQQVQRRITQQTVDDDGAVPPPVAPRPVSMAPQLVVPQPTSESVAPPTAPAPFANPVFTQIPAPPQPGVQPLPARRHLLTLSGELATILFLVWLATLAAAFFVGQQFGRRATPTEDPVPGAGYAPGPAGNRPVAPATPGDKVPPAEAQAGAAGGHVLVLASVKTATADDERAFGGKARELNDYAEKNPRIGFRPWFAVRRPASGGLQLVYGKVGDRFGIDMKQYTAQAEVLAKAGYKGAHWLPVDGR